MNLENRIFCDHLGHILASPEEGYLDLWTMIMHIPARWQEDLIALLIRAHELVHLRLTYSTGLGIFLDTISGLSSIKLFNLLKETSKGEIQFPLIKNLDDATNMAREVTGTIAFCQICESSIKTALDVWRYLQEAAATYAMLELSPDKILQETGFSESEVLNARLKNLKSISNSPTYSTGYKECLEAKKILGTNYVYPAILIASDVPLYAINLFQPRDNQKIWQFRGDKFAIELEYFCDAIQLENMNPLKRFRKLIKTIKEEKRGPLNEQTLEVFNKFIVPDLYPNENWQKETDKWVLNLIKTFGDFSPNLAPRALSMYHQIVDTGWTPLITFHDEEGCQIYVTKNGEYGFLRYLLGNLKVACFHYKPIVVQFPNNWEVIDTANWFHEFENIVEKHELPICIEK